MAPSFPWSLWFIETRIAGCFNGSRAVAIPTGDTCVDLILGCVCTVFQVNASLCLGALSGSLMTKLVLTGKPGVVQVTIFRQTGCLAVVATLSLMHGWMLNRNVLVLVE